MGENNKASLLKILFSGIGVAVFVFVANTAWEIYSHKKVGPEYVNSLLRIEDGELRLFIRNNSDEALDLKHITIKISTPELAGQSLGAYPDISKIYTVSATSGKANLEVAKKQLQVNLDILQPIESGKADHFGIKIVGLLGPLDLGNAKISTEIIDILENKYIAIYKEK